MELLIILIGGIALFWYASGMKITVHSSLTRMLICLISFFIGIGLVGLAIIKAILTLP